MKGKNDGSDGKAVFDRQDKDETLRFASLAAHQLKSPISAAGSLLRTLLGEYAGVLNPKQKDIVQRADRRLEEAAESIRRMMAIAGSKSKGEKETTGADAAALVRDAYSGHMNTATQRNIIFEVDIQTEPAFVRVDESSMTEMLNSILNNAFKYTPENGKIVISIIEHSENELIVSIADSGSGVPDDLRSSIFEPFFRTTAAENSTVGGIGLGLALVKTIVDKAGGKIWVETSRMGGADFRILLERYRSPDVHEGEKPDDENRVKVVIIGGVAAGPKVASKIMRLAPRTSVTIIEKSSILSYAGCGFPYYVSGVVKDQKQLMSTPLGVVRDPVFFQNVKNIRVMNETEATEIDRENKRVRIRNLRSGREQWIPYDTLVLATGSEPKKPDLPGADLKNIYTLHGVRDAEGIRAHIGAMKARDVLLIGGGLISVEMTEALAKRGCRVTIVEMQDQILGSLDWEMARLLMLHLESKGVRVLTNARAESFVGEQFVEGVVVDKAILPADMVIIAMGVRPKAELAAKAGLELGVTGAIKVNAYMCTSDPDIYAAGDCVENIDIITGKPCYVPLGSTANKEGRVVAVNICGGDEKFPGVVASTVCKVFDYCVARTGLTEGWARAAGYDVITSLSSSPDREPFMPGAKTIMIKLIADRDTGKLLGVQALGPGGGDKRVDVAATAVCAGMTVDQIANLDLCYAPKYSLAMDNLITAANIVRNKREGLFRGISPMEVYEKIRKKDDFLLIDVSTPQEYEAGRLPGSISIPSGSLRGRMHELEREKDIVVFCSTSLRGYEAALVLQAAGFENVRVMDGGLSMWPYEKI